MDSPPFGEFNGISHKIHQHLFKPHLIPGDPHRRARLDLIQKIDIVIGHAQGKHIEYVLDTPVQIEFLDIQLHAARLDL